jgi:hypothetical protein
VDYQTVAAAVRTARPEFDGRAAAAEAAEDATSAAATAPRAVDAQSLAEAELVRQVVVAPELRVKVRDLLAIEGAVSDPVTARLLAAVADAGELTGRELYDVVARQDREAGEALSTYLVGAGDAAPALDRFDETLARLTEFALRREVVRVQSEMRGVDPVKESGKYDELFRKAAELQHRLSAVRAGAGS